MATGFTRSRIRKIRVWFTRIRRAGARTSWISLEGLANVDAGARPGQTRTIRFTIDQPGTYRIVCTVPGHADAGMAGTLVVDSPD